MEFTFPFDVAKAARALAVQLVRARPERSAAAELIQLRAFRRAFPEMTSEERERLMRGALQFARGNLERTR